MPSDGPCAIAVHVTARDVVYRGAAHGNVPREPLDLGVLRSHAHCRFVIDGDPEVTYQAVIDTMDELQRVGIADTDIATGADVTPRAAPPPHDPQVTSQWHADGTFTAQATLPPSRAEKVKTAPVIIVTRGEALVNGTRVAALDDPALAERIADALPAPAHDTAIVQADGSTPFGILQQAVAGANRAGYSDVLFAVRSVKATTSSPR